MSIIHYQNNPIIQCDYCGQLMGHPDDNPKTKTHSCDICKRDASDNIRRASEEE